MRLFAKFKVAVTSLVGVTFIIGVITMSVPTTNSYFTMYVKSSLDTELQVTTDPGFYEEWEHNSPVKTIIVSNNSSDTTIQNSFYTRVRIFCPEPYSYKLYNEDETITTNELQTSDEVYSGTNQWVVDKEGVVYYTSPIRVDKPSIPLKIVVMNGEEPVRESRLPHDFNVIVIQESTPELFAGRQARDNTAFDSSTNYLKDGIIFGDGISVENQTYSFADWGMKHETH